MPFGISSASEVQQKKAFQTFGDIAGVHIVADDMLIAAKDDDEHDEILHRVLERAQRHRVRFNLKKLQLRKREVMYLGMKISDDGITPDPAKIDAIVNMPDPTDRTGVLRLLGMLNFLASFIPNRATITAPLRNLLKSDVPWHWEAEQKQAMSRIKEVLTSTPTLKLFDSSVPVTIQSDTSAYGIGACLMQNGHPVAYVSRSLSDTESMYAVLEKELLAILFAATKFHHYIYGTTVTVQCDHKPLEQIFQKPLHSATPRVQLMLMKLLKYKLEVGYVSGSKMFIADTLSRAHIPKSSTRESVIEENDYRVHSVVEHLPATEQKKQEFKEATAKDENIAKLMKNTVDGWPRHKSSVPPLLQPYWGFRDELHCEDGLLFHRERLVIPRSMQPTMLQQMHRGHAGIEKCRARARDARYWPGMDDQIEDTVRRCATCATFPRQKQKEPLIPHPIPARPWSKVGIDIFTYGRKDYLVVVDYFSKYPEVEELRNKTAAGVIEALKKTCARHGIPETIVSDNMPFSSSTFREFARYWNCDVITSSPEYPQSNGQAERHIGTIKQILRKATEEGNDIHMGLLHYRNTPISNVGLSPAQMLMSRRLRDTLPRTHTSLLPEISENVKERLHERQGKYKSFYDRQARPSKEDFKPGDSVRVQDRRAWKRGVINQHHSAPRSYIVTMEDGTILRRNRHMLRHSPDEAVIAPEMEPTAEQQAPRNSPRRSARQRNPPRWLEDYVR